MKMNQNWRELSYYLSFQSFFQKVTCLKVIQIIPKIKKCGAKGAKGAKKKYSSSRDEFFEKIHRYVNDTSRQKKTIKWENDGARWRNCSKCASLDIIITLELWRHWCLFGHYMITDACHRMVARLRTRMRSCS